MGQVREYHSREKKLSWLYTDSCSKRLTRTAKEEPIFLVHVDGVQLDLHDPGSVPRILGQDTSVTRWHAITNINAMFHHCWLFLMVKSKPIWMAQAVWHTTPCTLRMVVNGPHHPSCDKKKRKHPGLMLCLDSTLLICRSVLDEKPEAHYPGDTSWWCNFYLRKFKSIKDFFVLYLLLWEVLWNMSSVTWRLSCSKTTLARSEMVQRTIQFGMDRVWTKRLKYVAI